MRELPRTTFAFIAICGAITLVTGFVGWARIYGPDPDRDLWDAFYHTLLAFTGDGSYVAAPGEGGLNRWLRVARITGLLTTISAVATVVIAMAGHRILRYRAGRMRDHTVVIGASPFALDMIDDGRNAVVFDAQAALERLGRPERTGRLLMIPDPMTETTATGRILGQPAEVVFGDADAVTNVERARTWLKRAGGHGATLKLRVDDSAVARDLQLLSPDFAQATLISRSDAIARALVTSMAPTALAILRGQERVHVGLIGMGSVNLAVAEELALRCHHHALGPLHLTLVDRDIVAAKARIRAERPDLLSRGGGSDDFTIGFVQMNALECCAGEMVGEVTGIEARMPLTALVVAAGEDARNVAIAMRLRQLQVEMLCLKAPVFMRSDSQGSIAAAPFDDLTGGIVPFGGRHLDAEDLKLERIYDDLARGIHARWRNVPEVEKTPQNDWDNMPTAQRRASYRAALSAVELFYAAGFQPPVGHHLGGLRLEPGFGNAAIGDEALMRELSKTEHERWNAERRLEGFRGAPQGYRDDEKKRHPMILSYAELEALGEPAQIRKDRINVKAALTLGIERHEAAPDRDCWRKLVRIGLIGPLKVDPGATQQAVRRLLAVIRAQDPDLGARALEILTPNAPGFDRVAARSLAEAWTEMTRRPCRILLMNAASPKVVDRIAARHVGRHLDQDALAELLEGFAAESRALAALADDGHRARSLDLRGLGVSDAELMHDAQAYEAGLAAVQEALLRRADWMMFDTAGGTADWTCRAARSWEDELGKTALLV